MDYLILILVILLAIISGIITGLIPGIHINLIAIFILTNILYLSNILDNNYIIIFILTMGVIHSFIDFIPSILFGVPDSTTALSVLPAHKLVQEGNAYLALYLSALGSFFGMIFAFIIIPFFFIFLKSIYGKINIFIPYFLIFIILLLISFEKGFNKKFWSILIIIFCGALGMLSLNSYLFSNPLLSIFSGLFGVSTLFMALKNKSKIPDQNFEVKFKFTYAYLKSILIGGISAVLASISPGIGNAQAATISSIFFKKITSQNFVFVLSSINTINFILSFITFYLIQKTRNGAVLVISKIAGEFSFSDIIFYLIIIFFISIIGFYLTLKIGKYLIKKILIIDENKINKLIITFLFLIVYFLTDKYGLLLLIISSILGILSLSLKVSRVHLMSVLLIPVIFNLI